jgi:O-antigen ligase
VLYGFAIASLFLNGARSEFSGVLFLIPILELYHARQKLYSVGIVFLLMIWFAANAESIVSMLPDNRILQLFDVSHSSSGVAREQLSSDAWHTITENPIFGDFGSYPDGYYAHNILCAWVDFGLVGLVLLAVLLVWPAVRLFADGYFLRKKSGDFVLSCSFVCLAILWVLTAKSVPDMSVGAALGAYAKYQYERRRR